MKKVFTVVILALETALSCRIIMHEDIYDEEVLC